MSIIDTAEKRSALIVFTLSSFLTPFMGSAVNIALPELGNEFQIDAVVLSWIATAYLLAAAMFLVPFGRLADIYGRKRIYSIGIATYTIASFLAGISTSTATMLTFRVLQGIGAAMIFGTGVAILVSVFPASDRGKVLGISVAAVYAGLSGGPFIGGLMTEYLGWRSVFIANVPIGILILIAVFWRLKGDWAEAKGEKFDKVGSVVYSISLVLLMYGFSRLPETLGFALIAGGILGVVVFVLYEMRVDSPVFNMNLFRHSRTFTFSNLAALINYSATFAVTFLLSLYLQYIKGMGPDTAGVILVSRPALMTATSIFAGRLSDRVEPRLVASVGMGVVVVGLSMLIFLDGTSSIAFIIASQLVLGLGFGLFSSPNTNAIMGAVERRFYGVAAGTAGTMRLLGQMFSMGIATLIFAVYIGRVQITPEYHDVFIKSVRVAFIVFSALCFGGIFASLARGKMR